MSSPATKLEPFYVVDTHALIWYLLNDKKLSSRAKAIFQAAEQNQTLLIVSAIVVAELYYANVKNRWFADFAHLYADIISKPFMRFMPVDHTHIPEFGRDAAVPEMHGCSQICQDREHRVCGTVWESGERPRSTAPIEMHSRYAT